MCNQNNCSCGCCPSRYNGPNVNCVGLTTGVTYDAAIQQISEFICGLDGQDGVGITSITDNGNGTLTILLTDGTTFTTENYIGTPGPNSLIYRYNFSSNGEGEFSALSGVTNVVDFNLIDSIEISSTSKEGYTLDNHYTDNALNWLEAIEIGSRLQIYSVTDPSNFGIYDVLTNYSGGSIQLSPVAVNGTLIDGEAYSVSYTNILQELITRSFSCGTGIVYEAGDTLADAIESVADFYCKRVAAIEDDLEAFIPAISEDLSTLTTTVAVQGEELAVLQNDSYNYQIGQYVSAQGGVIFHRWKSVSAFGNPESGPVENYLVVDINNLSTSMGWGLPVTDVTNSESTWDGNTNTTNIVAAGGVGVYAAYTCSNSTANGKSDWYLPALDELSLLWHNRWNVSRGIASASGTAITPSLFWSSTELDANTAWHFNAYTGTPGTDNKSNVNYVRAVRKFSIS